MCMMPGVALRLAGRLSQVVAMRPAAPPRALSAPLCSPSAFHQRASTITGSGRRLLQCAAVSARLPQCGRPGDVAVSWPPLVPKRVRACSQPFLSRLSPRALHRSSVLQSAEEAFPASEAESGPSSPSNSSFASLGVAEELARALPQQGVASPTRMQEVVVASLLEGRSVALRAPTGSGKTLAYVLPLLTRALASRRALEAAGARASELPVPVLVVAPNQELAAQIARVGRSLLPPEASSLLVQQAIGSASLWRQRQALKTTKPLLLAGTPGRLADLSREGALPTHKTSSLVLDEADALLGPRFAEDLKRLTAHVGARVEGGRQTVLVSASLSQAALLKARRMKAEKECPGPSRIKVASPFESDGAFVCVAASYRGRAERVQVGVAFDAKGGIKDGEAMEGEVPESPPKLTPRSSAPSPQTPVLRASLPPTISHLAVEVPTRHVPDGVRRALSALDARRALVFLNRPRQLKDVQAKLESRGLAAGALHGDLSSAERRRVVRAFQDGKLRALLVSDVVARGLDVCGCDAVVNADLPADATSYAHRGGRTGRFGAPGTVVTLLPPGAERHLERLGRGLGLRIPLKKLKGGEFSEREGPESGGGDEAWTREADERGGRRERGGQRRLALESSWDAMGDVGTAPREGRPGRLAAHVPERGRKDRFKKRMDEEDPRGSFAPLGPERLPLRHLPADRATGRGRRERPRVREARRPRVREARRESGRGAGRER